VLLSMVGLAEELSLNALELPEIDMDGLLPEDVLIGEGDDLELVDLEGEIELPGADDETVEAPAEAGGDAGAVPEEAPDAAEILEDLDGAVDEASASIESDPAQNDLILIDEEIEQTGGAGDGWQSHGDIPGAEADNDALADAYLRRVLPGFGKNGRTFASPNAGRKALVKMGLTGSVAVYDAVKPMIVAVAEGQRTSTVFELDAAALGTTDRWWTAVDLGVADLNDSYLGDCLLNREGVNSYEIVGALLEDCPYHLYWFDKTMGWNLSYRSSTQGDTARLDAVSLSLCVSSDYAAGTYAVNALPARISAAVTNINKTVNDNKGLGDLEKVTAYADAICGYVEYNHPAADDDNTPYGDPWQLVWIFDGDPDTKVVCEGYAKGFKYLCDLSSFEGDVGCVLPMGMMYYGTGQGRHMWNSLKMPDGRCYLVDLTNCDAGDTCDYSLFLKGCAGEAGGPYVCAGLCYEFDDFTVAQFGADSPWLTYSNVDYGKEDAGGGNGDTTVNAAWSAFQEKINDAANNSTVTLTEDLTAGGGNAGLLIPSGKALTLDLAGHTLDRGLTAAKNDGYVVVVEGSLTVVDSAGGGKITGGYTSTYGGGIYVDYGASLTLKGGTICGNRAFKGGGIGTQNAKILISGGVVSNNHSINWGGGVWLNSGKIEMTGGEISGNQSCYGGGIWLSGEFEMKGGKITNNDAYNDSQDPYNGRHDESGGGVYGYMANITMSGGEISGNRANVIGGNDAVFHPSENTIYVTSGGGVFIINSAMTMSGGTIKNNISTYGGGVMVGGDNFLMTGGSITENTGIAGGGVEIMELCDSAVFTLKGGEVSKNKTDRLGGQGGGIHIMGTNGNATLIIESGTVGNNSAMMGSGIYNHQGVILMKGGSINDNTSDYPPPAEGGTNLASGIVLVCNSALEMSGGSIDRNETSGVWSENSCFTMSGGAISDNEIGIACCGLGDEKSILTVSGGEIKNNSIIGITLCDNSELYLSGGKIYGNHEQGGITCSSGSSYIYLSGSPVIKDNLNGSNENSNIWIQNPNPIIITGKLEESAHIGVRGYFPQSNDNTCLFTNGLGANGNIGAFFSDDPNCTIEWSENGNEAMLVKKQSPTDPVTPTPKIKISKCKFSVKDQVYTGKALTPAVTVKYRDKTLKKGTDYTVSYKNNVKPGWATVTVTGKGNYTGSKIVTFFIRVPLSMCKFTVKSQVYTGKAIKAAVTVKYGKKTLYPYTDYEHTYKNNKNVGAATVTLKGTGEYTGTKTLTFNILPRKSAVSKVTLKGKTAVLTLMRRPEASGYQVQYGLKSSFSGAKSLKVKQAKTVKATLKSLKKGKTYYVSVRAYKTVGKKTYYSAWSGKKSVKVK